MSLVTRARQGLPEAGPRSALPQGHTAQGRVVMTNALAGLLIGSLGEQAALAGKQEQ